MYESTQPAATGFTPPPGAPVPAGPPPPMGMSNGLMQIVTGKQLQEQERARSVAAQAQPHIASIAAHVRQCWTAAKTAKQITEMRMLKSLRARSGEYDAEKMEAIKKQGGSEIYMMLTATKCRGAAALLRDILLGTGSDKPWTLGPTTVPELPEDVIAEAKEEATEHVMQLYMNGMQPTPAQLREIAEDIKERMTNALKAEAKEGVDRMEDKMEDQLQEGGFLKALSMFIDDLSVFPSALLKGPVIRKKARLKYAGGQGPKAVTIEETFVKEWERVDPFNYYPAPHATSIDDGYGIEHHRLTKESLSELIGVEGYDDGAIKMVLDDYGRGGLHEWLRSDSERAHLAEKLQTHVSGPEALIDALQFWGAVDGKMLLEWGMKEEEIPDKSKMYWIEAWQIGTYTIKVTLNSHPLGHKPYYMSSYEKIPGRFWGNAPPDLIEDCQAMCNAAARALANNMGVASGPQVWVDVSRLPAGEDITQMYPWKIWQTDRDMSGASGAPMGFFQPETHAQELMAVYERFAVLADEYSGIPRYMTGAEGTPGAGRTASGLSMMIGNAGKTLKQVISNIDSDIFTPLLEQLYYHNLRFGDDPDLIGDINIVARGATSMQVKEAAAMRRNEFLQVALSSPLVQQIVGVNGVAAMLREQAKSLDMNADDIVPPLSELKQIATQQAQQQQMQQQMQAQQMQGEQQAQGQAAQAAQQAQAKLQGKVGSNEQLADGTPTTDTFSPR